MRTIKSIQLVTSAGAGDKYSVGVFSGITSIKEESKKVSDEATISVFNVYEEGYIVAQISALTPFVLTYE